MVEQVVSQAERTLLDLIEELSDCHDNMDVMRVACAHTVRPFPDYLFFGILLSDQSRQEWRFMPIENPKRPCDGCVPLAKLPSDEPIDPILQELGKDVSSLMQNGDEISALLVADAEPFWCGADDKMLPALAEVTGLSPKTVLGASWERPRGGLGWMLLGFSEARPHSDSELRLFALMVRVTSRMAMYPELVHEVARTERLGASLRRNVVHDLKTPLAVIRGYAETLLTTDFVEDLATTMELLRGVVEQTERLQDDLDDILKPLDDAWRPLPEEFDIARLVQQTIIAERHTERARDHRIRLVGAVEACNIVADRRKIRRVIENLTSNAVKYSPGTGNTVTVSLEKDSKFVRVSFRDEGIGMTESQLDRVFTATIRVVDSALGIEGTGFGLDSCKRVLDMHGGSLEAYSEPGEGSTFIAVIPLEFSG